ncbi:MAG: hypothetical protein D6816_10505, partial [Bacteroidetes bacterium]
MSCPANQEACVDAAVVDLTMLGATPPGGTFSGTGVAANSFDPAAAGVGVHTITYSYTDGNGCTNTCTFDFTVHALPTASITETDMSGIAADDMIICAGDQATLDASGSTGSGTLSYEWDDPGMSTAASITVSPTSTTTYTVTVTDANGCSSTASKTITVNPLPTPSITCTETSGTANNDCTICNGDNASLQATGGMAGYLWSTGASTQGITVSPSATTTYTVTVTDANGCTATATSTVTVTDPPTINILGPTSICGPGAAGTFTYNGNPTGTGPFTHSWTLTSAGGTGATPANLTDNGDGTADFNTTGLSAGMVELTYTVTDANNCTSTASITVLVADCNNPVFDIHDPCVCNNDAEVNGDNGTFMEMVTITGPNGAALPSGLTWTVDAINGAFSPSPANEEIIPGPQGAALTAGFTLAYCGLPGGCLVYNSAFGTTMTAPSGSYYQVFTHVDNQGYDITV